MFQPQIPLGYQIVGLQPVVTVSLAVVHRQADLYCSLTRELCEVPLKFLCKFQRESFFSYWVIAVPLFFAEKEGDENCELQFGGGYAPQIK